MYNSSSSYFRCQINQVTVLHWQGNCFFNHGSIYKSTSNVTKHTLIPAFLSAFDTHDTFNINVWRSRRSSHNCEYTVHKRKCNTQTCVLQACFSLCIKKVQVWSFVYTSVRRLKVYMYKSLLRISTCACNNNLTLLFCHLPHLRSTCFLDPGSNVGIPFVRWDSLHHSGKFHFAMLLC